MKKSIFFIISLIFLTDFCDTISQLFLKRAINSLNLHVNSVKKVFLFIIQLIRIPRLWFSFLLSTGSLIIWLFVLSKSDLNLAFSLDSMRYILIALASAIFLKEKIGWLRWLGISCVVLGIILVVAA
jgi:drug/metabolite transporter (DMT)-like permease